jgi:hypothetical protein
MSVEAWVTNWRKVKFDEVIARDAESKGQNVERNLGGEHRLELGKRKWDEILSVECGLEREGGWGGRDGTVFFLSHFFLSGLPFSPPLYCTHYVSSASDFHQRNRALLLRAPVHLTEKKKTHPWAMNARIESSRHARKVKLDCCCLRDGKNSELQMSSTFDWIFFTRLKIYFYIPPSILQSTQLFTIERLSPDRQTDFWRQHITSSVHCLI